LGRLGGKTLTQSVNPTESLLISERASSLSCSSAEPTSNGECKTAEDTAFNITQQVQMFNVLCLYRTASSTLHGSNDSRL